MIEYYDGIFIETQDFKFLNDFFLKKNCNFME